MVVPSLLYLWMQLLCLGLPQLEQGLHLGIGAVVLLIASLQFALRFAGNKYVY